jgi:hypothetical protein
MAPGYVPSDHPDFKTLKEFKRSEDAIKKGSDDDGSDDEPEDDMRLTFSGGVLSWILIPLSCQSGHGFYPTNT